MANMMAFVGPAQVMCISPFCNLADVTAWSAVDSSTLSAVSEDVVWRQLLAFHFEPAFSCLGPTPAERFAAELPGQALKQLYMALGKTVSMCPFALPPRSRLLLEIHELKEWDLQKKQFLRCQQAALLAAALKKIEAEDRLRFEMASPALELVSLQSMMGNGQLACNFSQLPEVQWGSSAETDLRQLTRKRIQSRKNWRRQQRDFLLQDLTWP